MINNIISKAEPVAPSKHPGTPVRKDPSSPTPRGPVAPSKKPGTIIPCSEPSHTKK